MIHRFCNVRVDADICTFVSFDDEIMALQFLRLALRDFCNNSSMYTKHFLSAQLWDGLLSSTSSV